MNIVRTPAVAALMATAWALLAAGALPGSELAFVHGPLCGADGGAPGALPGFAAAWLVMTAAMMLPDVSSALAQRREAAGGPALWAYVTGFLAVWELFGCGLFVAADLLRRVTETSGVPGWGDAALGSGALGLVAVGQFASAAFVRRLRAPGCVTSAAAAPLGWSGGLALGFESLRCCWAIMLFMLMARLHDPLSVAAFTLLVAYQRRGRWGCSAARAVGFAALADALLALTMRTLPL